MEYSTIEELINLARENEMTVSEVVIETEIEESEKSRDEVLNRMRKTFQVMKEAVAEGKNKKEKSPSGLSGGDAHRLSEFNDFLGDNIYRKVMTYAVATSEVNASMGKIVAGPTAGSSGIVPAVLLAVGEKLEADDEDIIKALFVASGLGMVVSKKATLAGAAGGCQAECGVGSAMAAGAAVELAGGNPEMVANAFALALKNLLGLVCDPVAGLVEVPCVKRNGFSASHALTAANMALAGVGSVIPPDEVVEAMTQIGNLLPGSLKETAMGGLAATETGLKIAEELEE
ncbi:MAG: L-serine ammonia-lyase, iron-sulfur-dependent, subunit alpha [Bacillota bacterium]